MQTTELKPFTNEAIRTFSDAAEIVAMEAALAKARETLGQHYPVVVAGRALETAATITSYNPAVPSEVVGVVGSASLDQALLAVESAARVFETWKRVAPDVRAGYLFKAAETVRARRDDFNALLVLEVGKSWIEADADTAEAIDFLEFYARSSSNRRATRPWSRRSSSSCCTISACRPAS